MTEFAQDQPAIQLAEAAPRRGPWRWLPGVFFLAVMLLGAVLAALSPGLRQPPRGPSIVTGAWSTAFERGLDAGLPWRDPAVTGWASLNDRLFGEARPGALVGTGGWLYTAEEFQTAPGQAARVAGRLRTIEGVRAQLARRGARLVVALLPAKARLYPEHLGRLRVPAENAGAYSPFLAGLQERGLLAPDLWSALRTGKAGGPVFLRTDTHWTPLGARVAAQALARAVRARWPDLDLPAARFRTMLGPPRPLAGDLTRFLPVLPALAPAPDALAVPVTRRLDGGGGLLGADPIAVTLVGTSYSADRRWNFAGALEEALGAEVLNLADEGRGPFEPMQAYLKGRNLRDNPPKLVVWEIPERYLK